MENTEQKAQVCYLCEKFSGYYTKGSIRFVRAKLGYCRKHEKIVENMGFCDCWRKNSRRLLVSKKSSLRVLSSLLHDISEIKQILEEANEDMYINEK